MELVIRNRRLTEQDVSTIRGLIQAEGLQGRSHLSARLCREWNWRQPNGLFREIACRDLLRQLERRGLIRLPPALHAARRRGYRLQVGDPGLSTDPIEGDLARLRPAVRVERVGSVAQRHLLRDILAAHHYLGYRQPAGASIGYIIYWQDRPLACLRFGPAAWKVAPRDQHIGWTSEQRQRALPGVVNNDRFLILPWVKVPHLASHLLGKICKRLVQDWREVYRETPVLAETFVDSERFAGTSYRAANWLRLGQSRGRGRNDRENQGGQSIKSVWIYPLVKNYRDKLLEVMG